MFQEKSISFTTTSQTFKMSINTNNILNYIKVTTTVQQPSKTTSNNSNISINTNNILNYIKVTAQQNHK